MDRQEPETESHVSNPDALSPDESGREANGHPEEGPNICDQITQQNELFAAHAREVFQAEVQSLVDAHRALHVSTDEFNRRIHLLAEIEMERQREMSDAATQHGDTLAAEPPEACLRHVRRR